MVLETVNSVLKMMIRKNLLYEVQKGTVISYRITKLTEKALTTNTTPDNSYKDLYENLSKDFDDFKRYVFHELALLRDHKASLSHNEPIQNNVIDLKERIASLEKQLKEKDVLIENLLRNKTPNNQDAHKNNDFVPVTSNEKRIVINSTPQRKAKIQKITSKNAVIVGDSMLKGLNPKGFKNHKISVKVHPGSTSDDLLHYVKPVAHKKPEIIILHCGTNDLQHEINTINNIKQIDDYVKSKSPDTKLVISSVVLRSDKKELSQKVNTLNSRLTKFAKNNKLDLVDHSNINESCLNRSKLHLNKKGDSYLANNIMKYLNQ